MDEMIYNLFLRSRSGWTLSGVLRYQLSDPDTAGLTGLDRTVSLPWQQLARQQQEPTVEVGAYRLRGTVQLPLLTGWQAVPVEGTAYFILPDRPLVTFAYGVGTPVGFAFNQFNSQQIGGGMRWEPTGTAFGLLGRRVMLAA